MDRIPTGIYRHYKGDRYLVVDVVPDSTGAREGEWDVLYISMKLMKLNVREAEEFLSEVQLEEPTPRFALEDRRDHVLDEWRDLVYRIWAQHYEDSFGT